jgi:NodT family efflux transporter outer membrane factor (OMF) lipoprotein
LGESEGNTVRLSIAAGYEVDLWKKISNRQNYAFLNLLASKTDMQTLFVSISAHISDLYFSLIEQKAQLELIDRIIKLNENNLELIENRYKEGLTSSLDVYMARQNILAIKSKKPQYEKLIATTSHALAVLIGRFPEKEISNAGTILPIPSFDYTTGIPSDLVKHRPDIQASLLRLEAQDKLVASAAADRFPSLNIMGAIGTGRIDFTNVISGTFWNLLLDIVAPVFDGGRRAAEVERNEALFMELLANYHKTVLRAFQEVEDGLIQNNTTRQWLSIVTQKLSASEATLRVAHDNYNMGLTDYLNVLISQTAYFEAESQLISAKRQLISDWIGLRRALGLRIEKES